MKILIIKSPMSITLGPNTDPALLVDCIYVESVKTLLFNKSVIIIDDVSFTKPVDRIAPNKSGLGVKFINKRPMTINFQIG